MTFAHFLIRDYELLESDAKLILLPEKYLMAKLIGLNFWFLTGGLFSYGLFWSGALFAWIYGSFCAAQLARIWMLCRLSLPRYWLCVGGFVMLCILLGWLARTLLISFWL